MNERQSIERRLRKKEQEIQSFEEKMKAAKIYAQALRDVLKMLDQNGESAAPVDSTLRQGSAVDQARGVILGRGAPVHIDDLLLALGKEVTRMSKSSLTGSLAAYVRRGEIFTRPAPNTFGLIELGPEANNAEEASGPPSGFGQNPPPTQTAPTRIQENDDDIPF